MNELITWFEDFKTFSETLNQNETNEHLEKFKDLLEGFNLKQKIIEENEKENASHYNVFYLIKYILDKEEITHSPFLADLLNFRGTHGQGGLFYNAFINQIGDATTGNKFDVDEKMFLSVTTEKWTGDGAIDIYIEYRSPTKRFAIGIENKIFAKDQPDQLQRYSTYLQREFESNYLLLYLTPRERKPEMPYSITEEKYNELEKNGLIKLITYEKHIAGLLKSALPEIKSLKVKSIVHQYLQTIKNNFRYD